MPEQRTRRDGNTCRRKRPNYRNRAPIFPFAPRKPPAADRSYPPESAHHGRRWPTIDRKSTRLNSSHGYISYAVFCLKKKKHERAALEAAVVVGVRLVTADDAAEVRAAVVLGAVLGEDIVGLAESGDSLRRVICGSDI